jgi:hypothetical protein
MPGLPLTSNVIIVEAAAKSSQGEMGPGHRRDGRMSTSYRDGSRWAVERAAAHRHNGGGQAAAHRHDGARGKESGLGKR